MFIEQHVVTAQLTIKFINVELFAIDLTTNVTATEIKMDVGPVLR